MQAKLQSTVLGPDGAAGPGQDGSAQSQQSQQQKKKKKKKSKQQEEAQEAAPKPSDGPSAGVSSQQQRLHEQ
jgi:hypothetical protein